VREPLISGVLGGLGGFLRTRLLMLVTVAYLLATLGSSMILPNVVLYTKQAIGEGPQVYAGYQFALRFGFKMVAGLLLGWLLAKTHPRAGLLATTSLSLLGLLWALVVPGPWFLVCFGILGAGELYDVYYSNYIITCSQKARVRRNLAYARLLVLPITLMPVVFGWISDNFGLKYSIEIAASLLLCTILLVQLTLPRWPKVSSSE
jgi:MFS family permease